VPTLAAPQMVTPAGVHADGWVTFGDGVIRAVGNGPPPADHPVTSLPDGLLAPGLVDAQVNGGFGIDLAAAGPGRWHELARRLLDTGVTAFAPTLTSAPMQVLTAALDAYAAHHDELQRPACARSLGVHLEGPFLSARYAGAHPAAALTDPDPDHLDVLVEAARGHLRYVTLAPERAHASDAIARLTSSGIRVAIGHSDASDEQVRAAVDAGATLVTHLYNAQRPFHHRAPGVVGAALTDPRLTLGLIADRHHAAPAAVRLAFAAAAGRVMLVTDATAALGMPPGTYELGGDVVEVAADGPPRRADGTLAGSALALDAAVRNVVACGVGIREALDAATRVPADALGRPDLGRIAPGAAADLVWLTEGLRPQAVWRDGQLAMVRPDAASGWTRRWALRPPLA
jgi:N-acetylglucosamine-6-phosphate deacetylase